MTTQEPALLEPVFPKQTRHFSRRYGAAVAALLAGAALFLSGCAERRTRAAAWNRLALAHPRVPERPVETADPEEPPELRVELSPPPRLAYPPSMPPRPRGLGAAGTNADVDRPAAPLISPQLTPQEQSAAQRQTEESLRAASQNLQATAGRTLSSTQMDLAEKVGGFIGQAREASRAGDWLRARNLARKAELLAKELLDSLR